jgi:hypothetical protein
VGPVAIGDSPLRSLLNSSGVTWLPVGNGKAQAPCPIAKGCGAVPVLQKIYQSCGSSEITFGC